MQGNINAGYWLPSGPTWEDFLTNDELPNARVLIVKIVSGIIILSIVRYAVIRFVFRSWGISLNINDRKVEEKVTYNEILEKFYATSTRLGNGPLIELSKKTGLAEDEITKWLRLRWAQNQISDLDKFTENCWLSSLYTVLCIYGYVNLKDEPWLFNLDFIWQNYTDGYLTEHQKNFLILGVAFLLLDSFVLVIKKYDKNDLKLRLFHHVASTLIFTVTWILNNARLSCSLLLIFDAPAVFLYWAKVSESCRIRLAQFVCTLVMITLWMTLRVFWYHSHALPSILMRRHVLVDPVPAHVALDVLILALSFPNTFWTLLILVKMRKSFKIGK